MPLLPAGQTETMATLPTTPQGQILLPTIGAKPHGEWAWKEAENSPLQTAQLAPARPGISYLGLARQWCRQSEGISTEGWPSP